MKGNIVKQASMWWPNLDGWRSIAIMMVLLHHVPPLNIPALSVLQENGRYGVALFFVISGFLISSLLMREKEKSGTVSLKNFYVRRALRLYPLYYAALIVEFILIFGFGFYSAENRLLFEEKLLSYFFYFSNILITATVGPFFYAWSLAVEEQFYLVYAFLAKYMTALHIILCAVILFAIKPIALMILNHFEMGSSLFARVVFSYQESIILGVVLGILYQRSSKLPLPLQKAWETLLKWLRHPVSITILPIILILILIFIPLHDKSGIGALTTYGFMGVMVLQGSMIGNLPVIGSRLFIHIGRISYGIYLMHMPVISILKKIHIISCSPLVIFSLAVIITVIMASICYRYFEQPILAYKSRFQNRQ